MLEDKVRQEEIDKLKKQIFERITKNFNIFEFIDNQDDDYGDDELSNDDLEDELNEFEDEI